MWATTIAHSPSLALSHAVLLPLYQKESHPSFCRRGRWKRSYVTLSPDPKLDMIEVRDKLTSLLNEGRLDEAFTTFQDVRRTTGKKPAPYCYKVVADALIELRKSEGVGSTDAWNCLIDICSVHESISHLLRIPDLMHQSEVKVDVTTYNNIVDALIANVDLRIAQRLVLKMRQDGVKPDIETLNPFINHWGSQGLFREILKMFEVMRRLQIPPNNRTGTLIYTHFKDKGEEAQSVVDDFESLLKEYDITLADPLPKYVGDFDPSDLVEWFEPIYGEAKFDEDGYPDLPESVLQGRPPPNWKNMHEIPKPWETTEQKERHAREKRQREGTPEPEDVSEVVEEEDDDVIFAGFGKKRKNYAYEGDFEPVTKEKTDDMKEAFSFFAEKEKPSMSLEDFQNLDETVVQKVQEFQQSWESDIKASEGKEVEPLHEEMRADDTPVEEDLGNNLGFSDAELQEMEHRNTTEEASFKHHREILEMSKEDRTERAYNLFTYGQETVRTEEFPHVRLDEITPEWMAEEKVRREAQDKKESEDFDQFMNKYRSERYRYKDPLEDVPEPVEEEE
eukprot:TRINITY_DN10921_c0_g1_i1.p1 TRINITY_DN10921_c0_g1~~TRINITY_DN10921_c0_g1_i1.p1  ORF type:complete len:584 (-),score=130.58 TRINITY_DN10921_c0_g1_i1:324-2012(-)